MVKRAATSEICEDEVAQNMIILLDSKTPFYILGLDVILVANCKNTASQQT